MSLLFVGPLQFSTAPKKWGQSGAPKGTLGAGLDEPAEQIWTQM